MVGGEGDDQLEWTWCHCWVPLQCAIVMCYGGGRGIGCYGWGEGDDRGTRVPLQGAVDVVPLLGAIVVYCGWAGGWRPTLGEWTWCHCGCHCSVLWWGKGKITTNFGGVDVPLQGAHGTLHSNAIQKKAPEKLPWASCRRYTVTVFSTLMTQKLFFAIWGLSWYNCFFKFAASALDNWNHAIKWKRGNLNANTVQSKCVSCAQVAASTMRTVAASLFAPIWSVVGCCCCPVALLARWGAAFMIASCCCASLAGCWSERLWLYQVLS